MLVVARSDVSPVPMTDAPYLELPGGSTFRRPGLYKSLPRRSTLDARRSTLDGGCVGVSVCRCVGTWAVIVEGVPPPGAHAGYFGRDIEAVGPLRGRNTGDQGPFEERVFVT